MEQKLKNSKKCIHELFQDQVERTPDATAVDYMDGCLTFNELNVRANRLAQYLRNVGVMPEVTVGIFLQPSIDVAVAVIGVLKAGGAYVQLDTRYPDQRIEDIVRDSTVLLVITTTLLEGRLHPEIERFCVDQEIPCVDTGSRINSSVTLDNAAFIRYTSGSSGIPKGVVNIHRGIVSRLYSGQIPDLKIGDVCGVDTNFGFGAKLLCPLALGIRTIIIPENQMRDVIELAQVLADHEITSIFMIPTLLRELLRVDKQHLSKLVKLRVVTTGAESLTSDIVEAFREAMPGAALINTYGSTEIGGTAAMIEYHQGEQWRFSKSVGHPLIGTEIYILNDWSDHVPTGVEGEICVGSDHLSRGYLHQPGLTAERFLPNPFSLNKGARLFRTGDLGRYLPNGEIEFLGRADRQIKIRGFRVELEEVESIIRQHPDVRQVLVIGRRVEQAVQLVAYVVKKSEGGLSSHELRNYMRRAAPEFMVPSIVVFLDEIPVSLRGKLNFADLPEPLRVVLSDQRPAIKLENQIQAIIGRLWARFLGLESIDSSAHFLDIGGDSITAMRITAAIWDEFGVQLPVSAIFEHPTVHDLSAYVDSELANSNY